ncbi:putative ammonium transporter 3 [Ceratina calcarata]|uniref:Ammonium transporter n=1 Tax=Ceratina calcarata TaxID=156304 RepID=A0AAJ7N388_9HYME|nr:putative ammonium transporter 3 [Ceratina calcarata]
MEIGNNETNITNSPEINIISAYNLNLEDSNWIVTNSFIIFTMQTGFGMLESGCVSLKNEVNIMMKNVVDIVLGGLTYWAFGFAMSFGTDRLKNPFIGLGEFLIDPSVEDKLMGPKCASFLFQLSFATTSTTIVSGAMAERCNFKAYCLFSFLNTIVYCVPAGWMWGDHGFLKNLGAVDIAGSGAVHLVGGTSALACAIMLGPRLGRYDNGIEPLPLGNPVNAIMGLFVLWWGWLAFNSGSTYGVSGQRWQYAARAAVSTMLASMGGGLVGLGFSLSNPNGIDILSQINGILGALIAVTGGCFLFRAWEAIVIGMLGAAVTCLVMPFLDKMHIDDPVGASATHGASGAIGLLVIGFFADNPYPLDTTSGRRGLLKGGGWYLLGVQSLALVCLVLWSFSTSIILLWLINKVIPIRMSVHDELLGADLVEHRIRHMQVGVSRAMSALRPISGEHTLKYVNPVGINPGHDSYIDNYGFKSRLMHGKRFLLGLKSSKNIQEKTITGTALNEKKKPNFAWLD